MPDDLTFATGLPLEWVSTGSYAKALKWLNLHDPDKHKMIHAQSSSSFLVLTSAGRDKYKKITKKLIKKYRNVSNTYH